MKKFMVVILWITFQHSNACDACGCSGMMMGFGNLSFYNQNNLGLGFNYRQFNTVDGITDSYSLFNVNINYYLNDKWAISLTVPYLVATRQPREELQQLKGISDISLKAMYYLYRSAKEDFSSRFNVNLGLNLPSGKFEIREASLLPDNFQLGTGSLDYLIELEYQIGKGNWVGLARTSYLINTHNTEAYKFGNQSNVNITAAYKIAFTKSALIPLVNLAFEHFGRDINSRSYYQYGTGGQGLTTMLGFQFKLSKWMIGIQAGSNVYQSQSDDYNPGMQLNFSSNYFL